MRPPIPDFGMLLRGKQNIEPAAVPGVRALSAPLLLLTAADATRDQLARDAEDQADGGARLPHALTWGPVLVAPLAAAAQIIHSVRPSPSTEAATRVLNASVVGIGLATLAGSLLPRGKGGVPPLSPLAFAAAGLLGIVLDRHDRVQEQERRRLERRADVVERLVPRRRPRLDRVVVHV